jgi:hypothetical protein
MVLVYGLIHSTNMTSVTANDIVITLPKSILQIMLKNKEHDSFLISCIACIFICWVYSSVPLATSVRYVCVTNT